ncbi:hypothetical protein KI387_002232, partial [Taxus chinensis]
NGKTMVEKELDPKTRDSIENCTLSNHMNKLRRRKTMASQGKGYLGTGATCSLIDMKGESSKGKERVELFCNVVFDKITLGVSKVERDMQALRKVKMDMGNSIMNFIESYKKMCITQNSIRVDMVEIKSLVLKLQGRVVKLEKGQKVKRYNLHLSSSDEEE